MPNPPTSSRSLCTTLLAVCTALTSVLPGCSDEQQPKRTPEQPGSGPPPPVPAPSQPAAPPAAPEPDPQLRVLLELAAELEQRKAVEGVAAEAAREEPGPRARMTKRLDREDLGRIDLAEALDLDDRRKIDHLLDPANPRIGGALRDLRDELIHDALLEGLLKNLKTRAIIGDNDIVSPEILLHEGPPSPELAEHYFTLRDTMLGSLKFTVMLVKSSRLERRSDGNWALRTEDVYQRFSICEDEDYVLKEPSAGECSGVVLSKNTILTARHCLKDFHSDGRDARFVFDFAARADGQVPTSLPAAAVLQGKVALRGKGLENDWVIFRTSTEIPAHRIPRLSTRASDALFAAGYPLGAPFKLIRQGKLLKSDETRLFTDLDAYQGTSGAPVFNLRGDLEAIVVLGGRDFDQKGPCVKTRVCAPPGCRAEEAFRLSAVLRQMKGLL